MPSKGFTHESTYNESKEWYTPREIFKALNIDFDLDPCSPGQEIVRWIPAQIHYTIRDDGLTAKWFGNVFMNPPYGMDTPKWMRRLSKHGNGIALVFARPDTRWFHDYVPLADAICFIKGRISFVPAEHYVYLCEDCSFDFEKPIKTPSNIKLCPKCKSIKIKDRGLLKDFPNLYADGIWTPRDVCGAASMLVAFGKKNAEALFKSNLGFTLPVSRSHSTDVQDGRRFTGVTSSPYENPSPNTESRQGDLFRS